VKGDEEEGGENEGRIERKRTQQLPYVDDVK